MGKEYKEPKGRNGGAMLKLEYDKKEIEGVIDKNRSEVDHEDCKKDNEHGFDLGLALWCGILRNQRCL